MHIEPGIVDGAKMALGTVTAAGSIGFVAKLTLENINEKGATSFLARTVLSIIAVFAFFQILPHYPVGVSEVHFIFGSTIFLLFGAGPAAIGLATGLLLQGLLFAPTDLPQYGMNVTTLIAPLLAMRLIAERMIPKGTAYVDIEYKQALALSASYQAGVVAWVAFWAFYGMGFTQEAVQSVTMFGGAYMLVVLVEPLVDLGILALAKRFKNHQGTPFLQNRVFYGETV